MKTDGSLCDSSVRRSLPSSMARSIPISICSSHDNEQCAGTMAKRHTMPGFLDQVVTATAYERWLRRKAIAHVKRDRKRGRTCTVALYKDAIHDAVVLSNGKDAYTGEVLDWKLISTYRNEDSKIGRHAYKAQFKLLPTVDHVTAEASESGFRVCGWRTNDAKNDLPLEAFLKVCESALKHAGYRVERD